MKILKLMFVACIAIAIMASCKSKQEVVDYDAKSATTEKRQRQGQGQGNRQGPPSIEDTFKMDVNNDGKLDKSEVKGRLLENFDKMDSNSDGFVTKEELENAPRPERGQGRKGRN